LFNQQRQSSTQEEVDKIQNLLHIEGQSKILDLCCGKGRHSLEFSRRAFDVIGVDRTAAYIEKARLEAEKLNLTATFILDDMREYCVPKNFDIIINMFGSFGYFENPDDDRKVVTHMYTSLRAGGKFLIETAGKEILARNFQERGWNEEGDLLILSERKVSQNWSCIETHWIVIQGTKRVEHRVSVRSYSAVELSSLLFDCGFSKVQVYGNLDGSEYNHMAQRLVVVGQK
jgi:SAM-dependent methyltransferase